MNTFLLKRRVPRTCKNSRGFTLIEILVVMAIIGILLAIAVPAILGVINVANRAKDKANATNVKVAVLAYNSDYGALPISASDFSTAGDDTIGPALLSNPSTAPGAPAQHFYNGLCGNSNASLPTGVPLTNTGLNTRNIPYLNLTKSQVDTNGILIQAFKLSGSSTYFTVVLDGDYDNVIKAVPDPNYATDNTTTININDVCAVWCNNDQTYSSPPNIRWSTTY